MGLILEGERFAVLSDILGDEDHLGDMDFKVAGTENGITSLQMDIKIAGITEEIMQVALDQAKGGRLHILGEMAKALAGARRSSASTRRASRRSRSRPTRSAKSSARAARSSARSSRRPAPRSTSRTTAPSRSPPRTPQVDHRRAELDQVDRAGAGSRRDLRRHGREDDDFGAFVNFFGAKDGLVHISQLAANRVDKVTDVVKEGDKVKVKLLGFDERGKVRLSMKVVDQKTGEDLEKKQRTSPKPPPASDRRFSECERAHSPSPPRAFRLALSWHKEIQRRPPGRLFCARATAFRHREERSDAATQEVAAVLDRSTCCPAPGLPRRCAPRKDGRKPARDRPAELAASRLRPVPQAPNQACGRGSPVRVLRPPAPRAGLNTREVGRHKVSGLRGLAELPSWWSQTLLPAMALGSARELSDEVRHAHLTGGIALAPPGARRGRPRRSRLPDRIG